MRKLLFTAAAFLCLSAGAAFSQETSKKDRSFDDYRNEFNVSYGILTLPDIGHVFGAAFGTFITVGLSNYHDLNFTGALSLSYYRYVHPMLGVGVETSAEACSYSYETYNFSTHEYDLSDTRHCVYISTMPAVKGRWIRTPHFCLYSKIALGTCFANQGDYCEKDGTYHPADSDVWFAFQLTLAGVEFGGEKHRGFVESGIGMQGSIRAGYRLAF